MKIGKEQILEINNCTLKKGNLAFWWLGQLGYVIKVGNKVIYIDTYLSNNPQRNIPPMMSPEEITNADYIIGTHDHEDHIDREVWHQLSMSSPNAKFVVPKLLVHSLSQDLNIALERFTGLDDNLSFEIDGIKITGIASAHEFLDQDPDTGHYPYLGYVIEGDGYRIYHSGDCCIYEGLLTRLKQYEQFDVIFLPINGRDASRYESGCIGNMTYQEAVDLAGNLKPRLVVPGHYDMFATNSENPDLFTEYLKVKYQTVKSIIPSHGEMVLFEKV